MGMMRIDLTRDQICELAQRYPPDGDDELGERLTQARLRGHMERDDLVATAIWKWSGGRLRRLCRENSEDEVKEISRASFSAESERLRFGALLALRGVNWPMASVILHFAFPDRYPILDVRAMQTVGGSTNYTFGRWLEYVELTTSTAKRHGISMRTLDKALWQYDRENPQSR